MLPTSCHTRVARVSGFQPKHSLEPRLSATSAAIPVDRHGCQLMQGKVTNKGAKTVIDSFTLSTSGKTLIKTTKKRTRPLMIMASPIYHTSVKPARRESASADL